MEYVQMTLDDWVQMKQKLKQELLGVKQSFVRIGYVLRKIEDQKLYERDGYKSIAEFAQTEYGLGPSITSRFMSINREYSVDGYSEQLRPEYAELGRSQLEEMLKLPDTDRQMIQPETSREDIRELKRFNKTEPAAGVADDISQLVEKFYQDNKTVLNAVYEEEFDEQTINRFAEIVNPGGNRSYKKGLYFMMMYENRVTIKKFGDMPKDMTWWEFYRLTRDIFDSSAAGPKTWQNHFGEEEDAGSEDTGDHGSVPESGTGVDRAVRETEPSDGTNREKTAEDEKNDSDERDDDGVSGERVGENSEESGKSKEKVSGAGNEKSDGGEKEGKSRENTGLKAENQTGEQGTTEGPKKEIAPAQKPPKTLEKKQEESPEIQENGDIEGQMELTKDFPEYCPGNEEDSPDDTLNNLPEEIKAPYKTRYEYLQNMSCSTVAEYLASLMRQKENVTIEDLRNTEFWTDLFEAQVDENGEEIECLS